MKHIKLITVLLLDLSLVFGTLYQPTLVRASTQISSSNTDESISTYSISDYENNQMIITYKNSDIAAKNAHILSLDKTTVVEEITDTQLLVTTTSKDALREKLLEFKNNPQVLAIQPNFKYQLLGSIEEPLYYKQWWAMNDGTFASMGYKAIDSNEYNDGSDEITMAVPGVDINVSNVWSLYTGTRPITVAIVDTGIDISHEDLSDSIYTNPNEVPNDGVDNDSNGFVDDVHGWNFCDLSNNVSSYVKTIYENDHGTHCAGIISAKINKKGIVGTAANTGVKILPIKVLGEQGTGYTADIIKGIQYAEMMQATICNLSLGYNNDSVTNSNDDVLKKVIRQSNMLFVIASGNGDATQNGYDTDINPIYPAAFDCDNIISVANLSCDGSLHPSSNYGATSVDIAAPGTCILSTLPNNDYGFCSGTSMSAPMVVGGLVHIYSYYPDINIRQAARILLNTAKPMSSLTGKVSTNGMLDIYRALTIDLKYMIPDLEAPILKSKIINKKNTYYKDLQVKISDKNISSVYYMEGASPTTSFHHGVNGTELTIKNNTVTIPNIKESTSYTIYAIDQYDNESSITVPVTIKPTTKISLSAKSKTLKIGKTYQLVTTLDQPCKVTYSSSNNSIAKVSSDGKITSKKKGHCKIYVKTINGLTATCKITVK